MFVHGPKRSWRPTHGRLDFESETFICQDQSPPLISSSGPPYSACRECREVEDQALVVAHALTAEGADASEDGTGRGPPLDPLRHDSDHKLEREPVSNPAARRSLPPAICNRGPPSRNRVRRKAVGHACVYGDATERPRLFDHRKAKRSLSPLSTVVRRITPLEAERLMGLPDGYTLVPYRGKPMADGPRYRLCGNGIATNCLRWIGDRIALFEEVAG